MENTEKRFKELAQRAEARYCTIFSDFLNADEISILLSIRFNTKYFLWGGYDGAERRVAAFGENCENSEFPLTVIKIKPKSPKFAEKLTHRDFLGSLMGLGIKRETIGDIIISENVGYIIWLSRIADYILQNLGSVRRTSVCCEIVESLPEDAKSVPEESSIAVASARLDVLIAAVYGLSRNAVKEYFLSGRVFVNSRLNENFSHIPKTGDIISVRGKGRFVFKGVSGKTRKNRAVVLVDIYNT